MSIAIRAHRLLTSSSADIIPDGAVIVDGARIIAAGPWDEVGRANPGPAEVVELGDVTLMPGLFDCHVHLSFDPASGTTTTAVTIPDDEALELMRSNAAKLLDAGVTTARDLGAPGTLGTQIKAEIAAGETAGPSLQVTNAPITVPGGHAFAMGGVAEGLEEVREAVRQRAAEGADLVKVMTTGGFMTAGSRPWETRYSLEELRAIVDQAHEFGLLTTTHVLGVEGIDRAVEAGFDAIEHCGWVTESGTKFNREIAEKIVERGVVVSPAMNTACMADSYFCPWDEHDAVVGNLRNLHDMGARIIAGTDAGIGLVHFARFADGLSVFADAGMSPREIIASATDVAAEACGLGQVAGKLAPGLRADVIAVDGNPTEDWEALRRPTFVMAAGRRHDLRPIPPREIDPDMAQKIHDTLTQGAGRPVAQEHSH